VQGFFYQFNVPCIGDVLYIQVFNKACENCSVVREGIGGDCLIRQAYSHYIGTPVLPEASVPLFHQLISSNLLFLNFFDDNGSAMACRLKPTADFAN
jgi:hypothetical protein